MSIKIILNSAQSQAQLLIHQTATSLIKCEAKVLISAALTPEQFGILTAIKNLPPPPRVSDIEDYVDRNLNSITRIVDRMVNRGLIERVRDLKDRRATRLAITPKGEEAYKKGRRLYLRLVSEIFSNLSLEEIRFINPILEKLLNNTFKLRQSDNL